MAKTMRCKRCGRYFGDKENLGGLSAGKAAVGAVLAGPAGAIVGAAMGNSKKVTSCPHCGCSDIVRV